MSADKLLELINKATQADLDQVDSQISETEERLDSLKTLRRIIAVRINGKPPRKQRDRQDTKALIGTVTDQRRDQVARYLLKSGSAKATTLAELVGATQGFHWVLKSPWFVTKGDYVQLTDEGKSAASKL